ncbi:hypothetical protein [Nocardia carnea]|uniref:hypothetical protein n=1 Tax=Nocardia carnea TaxID=37328 RepID=UPI00245441AB|nr:hypothetical protein [Nocardia carnea]
MATPGEVRALDLSGLAAIATRAEGIADAILKTADSMYNAIHNDLRWEGDAARAAGDRADRDQAQIRAIATAYDDLGAACTGAVRDMEYPISEIKSILNNYAHPPVAVADDWAISGIEDWNSESGIQLSRLAGLVDSLNSADQKWGREISEANDLLLELAPESTLLASNSAIDDAKTDSSRADPERVRASAVAFQQMFGRPPTSPTDWATAEVLNPNSYGPKYQGVGPEIQVVRINPVPGQGVVRVGQYIEQRDVSNPFHGGESTNPFARDFGDDRSTDPDFDPEHTRVATYIDYENGIVVMRQNPTVAQNDDGGYGDVKVATPEGRVWQNEDGSVRVKYSAANPFAPPGSGSLGDNPVTVNGDLVFTPTGNGVEVNGTRTNYPSLEVYQDFPNGDSRTVVTDPAIVGNSLGPAMNLPFHHDVGPRGGEAFRDFNEPDGWNLEYDVPIPGGEMPSVSFGPVDSPPTVPPITLPPGVA